MSDVDGRLRELFERKAAEVPPRTEVPEALRTRSRRRVAANAVLAAAVVVGLGAGAVLALRTIERAGGTTPGGSAPPPPSSGSPKPAVVAPCVADELRGQAQLEGAMGSREGAVLVSNDSGATCTLRGRPTIVLLDAAGAAEPDVTSEPTEPTWRVEDQPPPRNWPVVELAPGGVASFRVRWTNWCPDGRGAPTWTIDMGSGDRLEVPGTNEAGSPPCLDRSAGSTIEVGPFEPAAG
jgi:Protein of unknown function (DUF4232)